jgi:hypothetical protein
MPFCSFYLLEQITIEQFIGAAFILVAVGVLFTHNLKILTPITGYSQIDKIFTQFL